MIVPFIVIAVLCVLWGYTLLKYRTIHKNYHSTEDTLRKKVENTKQVLYNMNTCFVLINSDFIVRDTNYYKLNHLTTDTKEKRLGDLLHCRNAMEAGGCGMHARCALCGIRHTIRRAFIEHKNIDKLEGTMNLLDEKREHVIPCDVSVAGGYFKTDEELMILTINDITELKNMQRSLNIERENAISADKLKSAFIANMSHEIRTPLNSIVGFSGLLASASTEEEKKMYSDIISQNNERLLVLVNDILDLSQIEAGVANFEYSTFDVHDVLRELYGIFTLKQIKENPAVQLICEAHVEPLLVYSERGRVLQIMTNLIHNALKFTKEGEIRFGCHSEDQQRIRFYVSDTGIGIPAEELSQVFCRFTKLDREIPGTGVGLSLVQTIVHNLGGEISVESEVGKGSTFCFSLPMSVVGDQASA